MPKCACPLFPLQFPACRPVLLSLLSLLTVTRKSSFLPPNLSNHSMKYLFLGFFFLSLSSVIAKPVELENDNITFDAPDDFTPLTQDEMARKFSPQHGPTGAVGDDTRGVTISYHLTDTALQPEQLPDAQKGIGQGLNQIVQIKWIKNEIIEINGTKWICFEFISGANDKTIHNIELLTSYRGKLFVINFNASAPRFDAYQNELRASLDSIKIKDDPAAQSLPKTQ